MNHVIDTTAYLDSVLELLKDGKDAIAVPVTGTSMCPFLRPGDCVYLSKAAEHFRPGDIVLYRRNNGNYILHRIIKTEKDGTLLITGDNQTQLEPVDGSVQIQALVTAANRKGQLLSPRSLTWQFYQHIWRWLLPLRSIIGKIHKIKTR